MYEDSRQNKQMADDKETKLLALRRANAPEVARLTRIIVEAAEALSALEAKMEVQAKRIAGSTTTKFRVSFQPDGMLYEQLAWSDTVDTLRFNEIATFMEKVEREALVAATKTPPA